MGGRAVLLRTVNKRPLPRRFIWKARGFEDTADDQSVLADDVVVVGTIGAGSILTGTAEQQISQLQSSSASRRTASQAGFLLLSQSGERPERYVENFRFDTMPSSPILQAWANQFAVRVLQVLVEPQAGGGLRTEEPAWPCAPPAVRAAGRPRSVRSGRRRTGRRWRRGGGSGCTPRWSPPSCSRPRSIGRP